MSDPANVSGPPAAAATAAATAAPPKPAPPKPAAAGKTRRTFVTWFGVAWVAFTATNVGFLLGCIRFLFPNVLSEPPSKFKVGDPTQFEEGKVNERFKAQGTWIGRNGGVIYALS